MKSQILEADEGSSAGPLVLPTSPDESLRALRRVVIKQVQAGLGDRIRRHAIELEKRPFTRNSEPEESEWKVIDLPNFVPVHGRPDESFAALQEWEGVVTAVDGDKMMASLIDITAGGLTVEEIAEIPLSEVAAADQARVVPGAIFRWVIGYVRKASGNLRRGSEIYFRRLARDARANPPDLVFEAEYAGPEPKRD